MALITPAPDATVGSFVVGDDFQPLRVPYVDDAGDPMDWTGWSIVSSRVISPDGIYKIVTSSFDDPDIEYANPSSGPFAPAGIWALDSVVKRQSNTFATAPMSFIVEADDGWATLLGVRVQWRDAPADDLVLWQLLDTARIQVQAWAPETGISPYSRPPQNYVLAQITQARNLWNAVKTDPASQGIGDEGFVIRPFPMDWTVKSIIRPPSAVPVVR